MDYACDRCSGPVSEGVPFCPQCGAPQIRVNPSTQAATPPLPPGTPEEMQPPFQPVATRAARIQWSRALPGAALAGLLAGLLSLAPLLNLLFIVWGILAGTMSVAVYRRQVPGTTLGSGESARLGALGGLLAFLTYAIVFVGAVALSPAVRSDLLRQVEQASGQYQGAQAQRMSEWVASPAGFATFITLTLLFLLLVFLLLGTVGGYLARNKGRR